MKTVRIAELVNTCVNLSQRSGQIISKVQNKGAMAVVQKGVSSSDVFTEADLSIQKTLHHNLKLLYPKATIICEEDDKDIPDHIQPVVQPDQVL